MKTEGFRVKVEGGREKSFAAPPSPRKLATLVDMYSKQTVEFFRIERGLANSGLNPKQDLTAEHVSPLDIEEMFGKDLKYKTTNPNLALETKKELIALYNKIYGKSDVTNNEFMDWMVKGFIAEKKKFPVDWCVATASTAALLRQRNERRLDKLRTNSLSTTGDPCSSLATDCREIGSANFGARLLHLESAKCPHSLSVVEITRVEEVLAFESELSSSKNKKIGSYLLRHKQISEQLIVLRFNMEDRKAIAKEADESTNLLQQDLKNVVGKCAALETEVASLLETLPEQPAEENSSLNTLRDSLRQLKSEQEVLERNILVSQTMLEDKTKRAIQGENIFQDTEITLWETESNLRAIKGELEDVERLKEVVQFQLQEMKKGGGVSLWPKPVLHPSSPSSVDLALQIDVSACAFCSRWYSCMDVVVAPCMHMFHPFCIAELARSSNKCYACDTLFHPQWWTSWGFRALDEELKVESKKLGLQCQREDLLQALMQENKNQTRSSSTGGLNRPSDLGSSATVCNVAVRNASEGQGPLQVTTKSVGTNTTEMGTTRAPIPRPAVAKRVPTSVEEVDSPEKSSIPPNVHPSPENDEPLEVAMEDVPSQPKEAHGVPDESQCRKRPLLSSILGLETEGMAATSETDGGTKKDQTKKAKRTPKDKKNVPMPTPNTRARAKPRGN